MRKLLTIVVALMLMFCLTSPSFAAVGIKVGNTLDGTATDIKFGSSTGAQFTNDGSLWTFNLLLAGVGNGGAASMTSSTLVVPVANSFVRKSIANDSAFTAGTLANGVPGQSLTVLISEQLGSETFVITPATATTFTTASFDAAGDLATFLYIDDTSGWCVTSANSVTIGQ